MTHPCARTITWAGGTHTFNLANAMVQAIINGESGVKMPIELTMRGYMSGKCLDGQYGSTVGACFKRFDEGVYSTSDIEHVILLGLVGARELPTWECIELVDEHVVEQPLAQNAAVAFEILAALFVGEVANASASA
jgi:hypothetical protein